MYQIVRVLNAVAKFRTLQVFVFVFSQVASDVYATEVSQVTVGGINIALPPPSGFFRIDGKRAKVDRLLQSVMPPGNRLLAAFGSEHDLAEVLSDRIPQRARTFNAQSIRELEQERIPREALHAIAMELRKPAANAKLKRYVDEFAEAASSQLAQRFEADAEIKVGDSIHLGVFDQTDDAIATSTLQKVQITGVDGVSRRPAIVITATVMLRVRNRMVCLFCNAPYRDKSDLDWARRSVIAWRDIVIQANSPAD